MAEETAAANTSGETSAAEPAQQPAHEEQKKDAYAWELMEKM